MINLEKIKKQKKIEELLIFGIINIDKPNGPTSFSVTDYVRKRLGLNKASHMGTLDPAVSGVLPVLLGRACRLSPYFMRKDKTYAGIMKLHKEIDEEKLKKEMKKFIGRIKQLPPVKSRVKREEREREVYRFEILEFDKEKREVLFIAEVEAGTYIRKLIHDLGLVIGGAHMSELRRIKAGIFEEKNSVNLYDFDKAIEDYLAGKEEKLRKILIPAEVISKIMPVVEVKEEFMNKLYTGSPVFKKFLKNGKEKIGKKIVIFYGDKFIETARKTNEGEIIARPEFVLN